MSYKTITGRREDLEQIPTNPEIGYVGGKIFPVVPVSEKTGKFMYRTVTADASAQTGRSLGTAPTATLLADTSGTFTCAEAVKRYSVDKSEVKNCGGIESADKLGATASKRSVERAIESAQIEQLMTGSATDISSAIIAGLETGVQSVKRYHGDLAFVGSESVYRWVISQTEITGKLSYTYSVSNLDAADTLSVKADLFLKMLQTIYNFKQVLIFDDDFEVSGAKDMGAVVKLPSQDAFSHKMDAELGKTFLYMPDGEQPFEIESYYDENLKTNVYDAISWFDVNEVNSSAKYLVDGLDTAS